MNKTCYFLPQMSEAEIKIEKNKAKSLRKTRWWHNKCAKGQCYYCRGEFPPSSLTMDHIVPLVRGGKSVKANLVPACKDCNNKKKYLLPMEMDNSNL